MRLNDWPAWLPATAYIAFLLILVFGSIIYTSLDRSRAERARLQKIRENARKPKPTVI